MTVRKQTDVVIVGSGPGGATLARQLARSKAGWGITLLERGRDWRNSPLYGTYPGAMLYTDRASFLYTREGLSIVRPLMLGGATSMYCGCAARPQAWWRERYGIDLEAHAEKTAAELAIGPLPPELRGAASTRIAEAAGELGMQWQPQDKFVQPERATAFDCGAKCMLGCRCRAKWNAAEYVDDAVAEGIDLWTGATVDKVLHGGGQVFGVRGRRGGRTFVIEAGIVVVCAGGIGTPLILQGSGLPDAGRGMTLDTTSMVYGLAQHEGIGNEPPMTWSYPDDGLGVMFSTLIDPWLNYPVAMLAKGPGYALTWPRWGRTLGVMIKLKDEVSGGIDRKGRISKGLTAGDRERLGRAEQVARRILRQAGCDPETLFLTPLRGTHPSGTVRIDSMLSRDLETAVENLYACDASVFPEALARPTVLTIISLARRLADHLANKSQPINANDAGSLR
ncbi:MAG: FAD-dependent oxidoreductase [Chloroflexi bacterium]|nr:FAD-dependent oxidoreductase [Chloroflexota bacterium]MCI0576677.1 FAD-dependent oxidoreductase [Chloroflexota bacterium]MCI0647990.1 FAD-dependent oxidoreductase [Chloroflexota bacterium]MCI0726800.1 FAD-dependent oxidoreductase [Chloroflexota bacterium]